MQWHAERRFGGIKSERRFRQQCPLLLGPHDQLCDLPPGGPVEAYTAHFKALYPEDAADLLARLVELKNALRLLLAEQEC